MTDDGPGSAPRADGGRSAPRADGGRSAPRADGELAALRTDRRRRLAATAVAALLGLAAGWLHWSGFVLGGALVALPQRSLPRGLLAGGAFGVVAAVAFLAWLAVVGALSTALEMRPVVAVALAAPVGGGLLGGLARGVV